MICKGYSTSALSNVINLLILSGIISLGDGQELFPFTLKDARKSYQVKSGLKQLLGEHSLQIPLKLTVDNRALKAAESGYNSEITPDLLQGYSFRLMKRSGSADIDLIENADFELKKEKFIKESSKDYFVTADHTSHVSNKNEQNSSRNGGLRSTKPSSGLTPNGRFKHYRVRPTSGFALQDLKVHGNKRPGTYRRFRVRKNVRSDVESDKYEQEGKSQYPRIRYQNQYVRPQEAVVQKAVLLKSSQPIINYTLPTLEPIDFYNESHRKEDSNNHGKTYQETSSSTHQSINIPGNTSTRSPRVTKDVRKDGVTSFTPIINNKNNAPSKGLKTSIALSHPVHTTAVNVRKATPSTGLTASLGKAASNIAALTKSAAFTASLTKSTSKVGASPPVYVPTVHKPIAPRIPVTLPAPVTVSPLSPPVPQLNQGIKIPVAPSVKHALNYEKRILSSIKSNTGNVPNQRVPLITPFNPYTTLFLPQSGGGSLGQLGPYHIPHQIPILNLPLPYGF